MDVLNCIVDEHDLRLVMLAAVVCVSGCAITLNLFERSKRRIGRQRAGWIFLASVAGGASIWCTHFIGMLAYRSGATVSFDAIFTVISLFLAVGGAALGFYVALTYRAIPEIGGMIVGCAIAVMHYAGMVAYKVHGIVAWNWTYVAISIALSVTFAGLGIGHLVRLPWRRSVILASGALVLAVVSLHFIAMTAIEVVPYADGAAPTDPRVLASLAVAVAGVALIIVSAGVTSYVIDSEASQESMEKLRHLALNDPLTGLPNRLAFAEYLDHELARARSERSQIAVIGIDLNRFKEVNDLRGHDAGDRVLATVGQRLQASCADGEYVARIGGDEFAAVKRFRDQGKLEGFLEQLETSLSAPIDLDESTVMTGGSLGVAIYPQDGTTAERLVSNADLAMYRAKIDMARSVCFYEAKMDEAARDRRELGQQLRQAIELEQFELYYQVQTTIATGEVTGYEVLLRWHHPERGFIPPSDFIPIAEETGLILELGEWVLRSACAEAAKWKVPIRIAVNISAVQFAHVNLERLIHHVLLETGLSPHRLELELTESTIIADKPRALHALRGIRALGVSIAIDDFGTGYSSIDTLRSFPFDKLKLDKSFMNEIGDEKQSRAILRAMLTLGKSLDITVLAEGVETEEQLAMLHVEGCDEAQGYLLGRPAPAPRPGRASPPSPILNVVRSA